MSNAELTPLDRFIAFEMPKKPSHELEQLLAALKAQTLGGTAHKTPMEVQVTFDFQRAIREELQRRDDAAKQSV